MVEKTLKQNVLATIIGSLTVILCTFGTGHSETLDAVAEQALTTGDTATAITRIEGQIQTDPSYHYNYYIAAVPGPTTLSRPTTDDHRLHSFFFHSVRSIF